MEMFVAKTEHDLKLRLRSLISELSNNRSLTNKYFYLGLAGGSLIKIIPSLMDCCDANLENWRIFFCDERVVPFSDPDSIYGEYMKKMINFFTPAQFVPIKENLPAEMAAIDYAGKLHEEFGTNLPTFDLLILGVGDDGHICSIFPNHTSFRDAMPYLNKWVISVNDAPKPPPNRISLTLSVINNARNVIFVVTGESKAAILKEIIVDKNQNLPAARVNLKDGKIYWIIDEAASKYLK